MRAIVCLPTRNECDSISLMVKKVKKLRLPVFVSDEHSTDGTIEIARKLKVPVYQRTCSGKGCGVQTALNIAKKKDYDILVLIDCDNTYPVEDIPKLLSLMKNYDMVVGERKFGNVPFVNRIGNFVHIWAINLLFFTRLKDINSGLRAMKVNKFAGIIDAKNFDIEAQITCRALKRGFKVKEIPINYHTRTGESKLRLMDGISIFWRIIIERFTP